MMPRVEGVVDWPTNAAGQGDEGGSVRQSEEWKVLLTTLDFVGDKWTMLIVDALSAGPARFSELARQVDGISSKALSQALKSLETQGLVDRRQFLTVPPKVIYTLTTKGGTLIEPISGLLGWAYRNTPGRP